MSERYIDPNSGAANQPGGMVSPPAPTTDQDGATDVGALVEDEETNEQVQEAAEEKPAPRKSAAKKDSSGK